jgi:hypothetical protein
LFEAKFWGRGSCPRALLKVSERESADFKNIERIALESSSIDLCREGGRPIIVTLSKLVDFGFRPVSPTFWFTPAL